MKTMKSLAFFLCLTISTLIGARDILLEFKGAYFHPTNNRFRDIYKNGALYGPEITFELCDQSSWYGFASIDLFHRKGHSIGLDTLTSIRLVPIGLGLKYLSASCFESIQWYAGLGFQPIYVSIENDSPAVPDHSKWVPGGIAKVGTYIDLPQCFFLDLFVDYSFAHISSVRAQTCCGPVVSLKSNISGIIVGAGLGYRF